jgi:protein ImuB
VVARACACAQARGVQRGAPLAFALALLPRDALTFPLCPEKDFALLARLARWALKFSPLVAIDSELITAAKEGSLARASPLHYGFHIDLAGTDRVHGGEEVVLTRLDRTLHARGLTCSLALTPTLGASWALSRFGRTTQTTIEDSPGVEEHLRKVLATLPVESLRLDDETSQSLSLLGITCIEQLLALPTKKLGARFPRAQGPRGILTRLRQALGTQHELLSFIHPPTIIRESRRFEVPLTNHASIEYALLELLQKVFATLLREGKTTRALVIEVISLNLARQPCITRKELALCHATRDIKHARSVVHLTARLTSRSKAIQHELIKDQRLSGGNFEQENENVQELMNHLVTRLGNDRVLRVQHCASYIPEASFGYKSVMSQAHKTQDSSPSTGLSTGLFMGLFMKRPSYLFDAPQPISAIAMLPDKPPSQLTWQGQRLKVTSAEGPERICLEWWQHSLATSQVTTHGNHASRDYFRVQDQTGRWLWVFRENAANDWFVHGMWV